MSSVLYYSRMCENCNNLLGVLAKSQAKNDMHFVCVDKRERSPEGKLFVIMSNGARLPMPPNVTKVPALLLLNKGNRALFGNEIMDFLRPMEQRTNEIAQGGNGEPTAYAFGDAGVSGVASDQYSFLDQTAQSMTAKGDGGMRQLHSYATVSTTDNIETPPDMYAPDRIGEGALEDIQSRRNQQFGAHPPAPT